MRYNPFPDLAHEIWGRHLHLIEITETSERKAEDYFPLLATEHRLVPNQAKKTFNHRQSIFSSQSTFFNNHTAENVDKSDASLPLIKAKIQRGLHANPTLLVFLEKLMDPRYDKENDFHRKQIETIASSSIDLNLKQFVTWILNHIQHIANSTPLELLENTIDLFIRSQTKNPTSLQNMHPWNYQG